MAKLPKEIIEVVDKLNQATGALHDASSLMRDSLRKRDERYDSFLGWAEAFVHAYLPGREFIFDGRMHRLDDIRQLFMTAVDLAASRFYEIRNLQEENLKLKARIAELEKQPTE